MPRLDICFLIFTTTGNISPDGTRVVYRADQDTDTVIEIYSVLLFRDLDDDGIHGFCDICPADSDPGQQDFDADGLGDVCDLDDDNDSFLDPFDCHDTDASVWSVPGEVLDFSLASDGQTLSWMAPADLGGISVVYDTLRSGHSSDFVTFGVCVETDDGADTMAVDLAVPALGTATYYLSRAENLCGGGSLGTDSSEAPRQGRSCP